jgi:hypothetical protein
MKVIAFVMNAQACPQQTHAHPRNARTPSEARGCKSYFMDSLLLSKR